MGVKILNLLPVTGNVLTPEMFKYMCKYLEPDTEVQTYQITSGPPSIECEYDEALAAADVLRLAKKGEEDGFQAIFINCFGDPAAAAPRISAEITPQMSMINSAGTEIRFKKSMSLTP